MKQVTQRLRDGRIEVLDVPMPELRPEGVLVEIRASLLSAGTERSKVVTGRQSLLGKARSRPDHVRQVMDKARRDGVRETIDAVRMRLDQPGGLGYSSCGVVVAVGARVRDLEIGDRVACGGADYAHHAEVNYVPANLCVRLPDGVGFDEGAFATVGSVALHGIRQANVHIGERVAVIGLGLIGQLAGQILRAAGSLVVGVDLDSRLAARAVENQAVDRAVSRSEANDEGVLRQIDGCDAVIVTAASRSSDPLVLATRLARDRARVVVVGDVNLELDRSSWYDKELELRLSRSYGPGRYDVDYEERGLDYPIGYVRWTERRNMEAFVALVASGRINLSPLITETVDVALAPEAYDRLAETSTSTLAVLLRYQPVEPRAEPARANGSSSSAQPASPAAPGSTADNVGLIGAGSFAQRVLIPALRDAGFTLTAAASASGLSAAAAAERFGFARVGTVDEVIDDPDLGLVVIATRHASHATLAERALKAGKHVFVEKPPAITPEELAGLYDARARTSRRLAVGFNRRHAPLIARIREHFSSRTQPMELLYRVNAGPLPAGHWLNQLDDGGGRLIGEGCHFVDLACCIAEALPSAVLCSMLAGPTEPLAAAQSFVVTLTFADGSSSTIVYAAGGATGVSKEYLEVHAGGRSALLSDFRRLTLYEGKRASRATLRRQDKGHRNQAAALRRAVTDGTGDLLMPVDPLNTMGVTFAALRSAELGRGVSLAQAR